MVLAFAFCVACVSLALLPSNAASPPVKVSLRTSWPAPPLLLEVIESVALENPDAFFPLLDVLTGPDLPSLPQHVTPEVTYEFTLQTAVSQGLLSEPGALAMVEMNLALHAATPKIEAFYQYYLGRHEDSLNLADNEGCRSWVDWYSEKVYDVETLVQLAGHETVESSNQTSPLPRPRILPFDHIYPPPSDLRDTPLRTAIFYASPTSPNFRQLHEYLLLLATTLSPRVEYVFRHIPPCDRDTAERSYLSGYGVTMDMKKMDYLALDDRRSADQGSGASGASSDIDDDREGEGLIPSLLQAYPENSTVDSNVPLTEEELWEIGVQTTQLIFDSSNPLSALKHLSQDFPKYATSIARRVAVNASLSEEISNNQAKAQPGVSMVWLNGNLISEQDMNPFGLLKIIRKERELVRQLTSLGLTAAQAVDLLTHPAISVAQSGNNLVDGIFDASDRPEGGDVVIWWNDMEKDSRYARWSPSMQGILRPLYPGTFHNIRHNIWNVVLVLDLTQTSSLNFLASTVSNIIQRNFPFRFGVAPSVETEESTKMASLIYWLSEKYGRDKTMEFIKRISQIQVPIQLTTPTVDWSLVRAEYDALVAQEEAPPENDMPLSFDAAIERAAIELDRAHAYAQRLGATPSWSPQGHAFVNGKHYDLNDDFLRHMQIEVGHQLQYLQEKVYLGEITDEGAEAIGTYFYDLPTTKKRRLPLIYAESSSSKTSSLRVRSLPEVFMKTGYNIGSGGYIYPPGSEHVPLSIYVVADLDSEEGTMFVREGLASLDQDSLSRITFIHNPSSSSVMSLKLFPVSTLLCHLVSEGSLYKATPYQVIQALGLRSPLVEDEGAQVVISSEDALEELIGASRAMQEADAEAYHEYIESSRLIVKELGLAPGEQALVVNGRIIAPIKHSHFLAEDFKVLEVYEMTKRVEAVFEALEDILPEIETYDRASLADVVSSASSIISAMQIPDPSDAGLFNAPYRPRQRNYRLLDGNYTRFELGDSLAAVYQFGVILDPLSEAAQKWSSLFEWLSQLQEVFIEMYIHPAGYREVPLKRFYRYNLIPRLSFGEDGQEIRAAAVFGGLPVDPIYTLGTDVPPAWLVRPRKAQHDLDNIQLGSISEKDWSRGVEAVFDLDYLVIEGHARDTFTNAPPRGVQLQLTTSNSTPVADTQVVANLGYVQFRAKPGVFQLEIRKGRGRDIFKMESVGNEGWDSPTVEQVGNEITLTSFEGLTLYPRLARLPGMERADVLAELDMPVSLVSASKNFVETVWSTISSVLNLGHVSTGVHDMPQAQADINIFTVASGLLYERFLSIMVLSVLRNTKSSVKFWFIENFLSPSFLEFIPHFAEAYGFQYELVTYKWPSWLRAQREKQRIIWAYKILFLDVLFPMDLKKVIFVDADQIVRTDLKELVDLDLHGAPYAYTPMGDDNTDMEGFRFWKTGYWKEFLQGRPYHISALYVIDLVRFRQMAAGDILRGHYQQLSADPNSLSNLDQDLPNNLQREVPIFSLDEDWLWCETWCSKDRLHRAKTIDLCQNPLTKEPKLARARQIPEWEEYDTEIAQFARKLSEEGLIHSDMAAADANVLASAAAGVVTTADQNEEEKEEDLQRRIEL